MPVVNADPMLDVGDMLAAQVNECARLQAELRFTVEDLAQVRRERDDLRLELADAVSQRDAMSGLLQTTARLLINLGHGDAAVTLTSALATIETPAAKPRAKEG